VHFTNTYVIEFNYLVENGSNFCTVCIRVMLITVGYLCVSRLFFKVKSKNIFFDQGLKGHSVVFIECYYVQLNL
jgi:uncharacterized membrane protein YciS (DUF1049 family)